MTLLVVFVLYFVSASNLFNKLSSGYSEDEQKMKLDQLNPTDYLSILSGNFLVESDNYEQMRNDAGTINELISDSLTEISKASDSCLLSKKFYEEYSKLGSDPLANIDQRELDCSGCKDHISRRSSIM